MPRQDELPCAFEAVLDSNLFVTLPSCLVLLLETLILSVGPVYTQPERFQRGRLGRLFQPYGVQDHKLSGTVNLPSRVSSLPKRVFHNLFPVPCFL